MHRLRRATMYLLTPFTLTVRSFNLNPFESEFYN